jgi:hypothetical protein
MENGRWKRFHHEEREEHEEEKELLDRIRRIYRTILLSRMGWRI